MTIREVNELKTLRIMRLVLDNFMVGERFTNKDVKRLIERDNRWASDEEPMPNAVVRCFNWMETRQYCLPIEFDGGCNVVDTETGKLLHVERDDYQPHELPTGKSFADRFKYAPWVNVERERFKISGKTVILCDGQPTPYLGEDVVLTCDETIINEPFYGERYVFSINDKAERIYEKLLRDYQRGVQLCVNSCALKFMARFGLTAEEYVELVNNIVE